MNLFLYQIKQAYLSLKRKPGFVFSIVTTMGITLGALLCTVTLNYLLLVEPLPYPEQDRLFIAEHQIIGAEKEEKAKAFSYPGLVHLYKSKAAFEQAAMIIHGQGVIISHNNQPLVNTAYITPEFHQILVSPLALGRKFEASEALDSNNPVAMLSYHTWQQDFNANTDILEKKINLSGISYRVIGVLAESFTEPELVETGRKTQVWLPWGYNQQANWRRQNFGEVDENLKFIGRLKKGVSASQAAQILTPLVNPRWQEGVIGDDFFKGWSVDMRIRPLKDVIVGHSESIAIMLLASVMGLVMIACANISNLFMARTAEKQRQMVIQAAIGATKKHLFKAMFAETTLLMFMSIILALVIAKVGFYIMQHYLGAVLPRVNELSLNPITFVCAILFTIVFAWFFAKLSTRLLNYHALNTTLQSSGKGSGLQISKQTRHVLIASQVALATVLVFANISLLKDAVKTINTPIGFATDNISTLLLNYSSTDHPSRKEVMQIMAEITEKLEALPQVESLSQSRSSLDGYYVRALTNVANNESYTPYFNEVDQQYFSMIEQQILQGDNFTIADRRDGTKVVIVNQAFAKQLKADGDVLGLQLSMGEAESFTVVGIVKNIAIPGQYPTYLNNLTSGVPIAYSPSVLYEKSFLLKLKSGHSVTREQLGELIGKVDSRYSVFSFKLADDILTKSLFAEITTAVTTAALVLITFFLAGIGLYGILSYSIQMRRFELGTRMAVGAKRHDLILLIIKDNVKAIILGVLFSLIILISLYLFFSVELSYYITTQLIPMFVATILLVSTLTLVACYFPLRQYINRPAMYVLRGSD